MGHRRKRIDKNQRQATGCQKDPKQEDRKLQRRHLQRHLHADHAGLCILNESPDNTQDGVNVDKIWIRGDNIAAK